MIYWLVEVEDENNDWTRCVVRASSEKQACFKARQWYTNDGMEVWDVSAEEFNTFDHGDISDYNILT